MADMSTHLMLDDVDVAITEAHDAPAFAVAGYVNGRWANWNALVTHYKGTSKHLLSIAVTADATLGAQALDIETGDATNAEAPAWVKATAAAGRAAMDLRYYPKVYTSAGNAQALIATLSAAGIPRNGYMLWSAHYTNTAHICGPTTCGYPQADATQYTDRYAGASLDGSVCYGYFFSGPPVSPIPGPPPPPPGPTPEPKPLPAYPVPGKLSAEPGIGSVWCRWGPAGAGASYHVQLWEDGKVLLDQSTSEPAVTWLDIAKAHPFQWRVAVHADAAHEASKWSDLQGFTTKGDPAPPKPPAPKPAPPVKEPVLEVNGPYNTVAAVETCQKALNVFLKSRGVPPLKVDGIYGRDTRYEIEFFQQYHHLLNDGIVGPKTWALLGDYS